ncbi:MFS general substrate transporter [Lentithecium fluviatile CBS 122367]|uniref:MFS general substrate transporter n=1 Tax=Lentithecium fluviatile CBS 122367 TaxID=1168545 RepID=A0A6G1IXN3_9PLEO|nr:MFS general substrate transporter [Lentithecium fluviatile CBS 122367]
MFLVGVDSSIIGVVTPRIMTTFHSMDDIAWYGSGYMLPHTVLQPTLGTFYKAFNVTYVYLLSIFIFEVGSCLCAAAPTSTVFVTGRGIAECGGAGIFQGTLSIVSCSVSKKKVPIYYGYVLSVQAISACSAPIFGDIFADKVSWRWCFWINLPLGSIALFVVPWLVRPTPSENSLRKSHLATRLRHIDWLGTLLFRGAFTSTRGTSATNNGIRMIALDASRIFFIIISGILVSTYQHYMPYMVTGTAINIVGAGLQTTLGTSTSTALSATFLVIAGAGAGLGGNQPFTAP